jgi:hypothetical protein
MVAAEGGDAENKTSWSNHSGGSRRRNNRTDGWFAERDGASSK